ncbi:MAG: UDP-2,3-diacylglucosamine diphosphatase [Syntrophaceae bacterium]|nr:UDP-2,3-diacylglucosamine diphosphatase [Syntrophaceae bacterium]
MAPFEKDWIFVADAHFTGREPKGMEAFLRFLDSEMKRMGHLVILGDLFEFFFGFKNFSSNENTSLFTGYLPVFHKFERLFQEGIRIKYFEGNHDFSLQSFFSEQFKMEVDVHPKGGEVRLGEKRAFIAHGDLTNPKQRTYRIFRSLLKNRWTYGLMHMAGPHLTLQIAQKLSEMSYQKYHSPEQTSPPPAFRAFAHQRFLEGYDIVILGHSHFPEEVAERVDGRECLYFNVGDWMVHRSFLRFTPPGHFKLSRYV